MENHTDEFEEGMQWLLAHMNQTQEGLYYNRWELKETLP